MSADEATKPTTPVAAAPQSLTELFLCMNWLALQSLGGAAPIAHRELVERRKWLTPQQFLEDWTVAQAMPGPNVINLTLMLGDKHFGVRGAVVALGGLIIAPLLIIVVLAMFYTLYADLPIVERTLRGMGAVAAGLIIGTGLKLSSTLKSNPIGIPIALIISTCTFILVVVFRWPLVVILPAMGIPACCLAWWRITSVSRRSES